MQPGGAIRLVKYGPGRKVLSGYPWLIWAHVGGGRTFLPPLLCRGRYYVGYLVVCASGVGLPLSG